MSDTVPASAAERREALRLIEVSNPELALKVEPLLDNTEDPVLNLLRTAMDGQAKAIAAGDARIADAIESHSKAIDNLGTKFWWVLGLVALSMILNVSLVGTSIVISAGGWTVGTNDAAKPPLPDVIELPPDQAGPPHPIMDEPGPDEPGADVTDAPGEAAAGFETGAW